jgi:hypothetical protein
VKEVRIQLRIWWRVVKDRERGLNWDALKNNYGRLLKMILNIQLKEKAQKIIYIYTWKNCKEESHTERRRVKNISWRWAVGEYSVIGRLAPSYPTRSETGWGTRRSRRKRRRHITCRLLKFLSIPSSNKVLDEVVLPVKNQLQNPQGLSPFLISHWAA